ncbi:winged helix-turn-helix domain-containing protein [Ahniella affigens]|uniref:nSTAND1 domain-containing NTPase n=1 Tax=Ahniella affigens TaxID=2021234 RepID=UPI00197D1E0A|nr:winged helix-turn-helix domain-containing protein [Ahniella affigens]
MQRTDRIQTLSSRSRFRVGAVAVQPDCLTVVVEGSEIALEPRVMEVLVALAEHAGEVVSAEQLLVEVWRGTFYGDNPVHKAIAHLRRVFQDDVRSPRFIETIRKRGYRLVAEVRFPGDYRRAALQLGDWASSNPFVGLNSFDRDHASVFCGRSRATADLLAALRRQIETQQRLVLVVGASGCGKSSLLQAGVLPLMCQEGGFDGLEALSTAHCDLAGVDEAEAMLRLAHALCDWQLEERPVFLPDAPELAASLRDSPEAAPSLVDHAFRRVGSRKLAGLPFAHLLLLIDHAEALVVGGAESSDQRRLFMRAVLSLCDSPRVLVVVVIRSDFYPGFVEAFPEIAERKQGDGHVDVLSPRSGEIAQIIRTPAALAGLSFEEDPETRERLDDVLRDAAISQVDALPMLQHTLQILYERRSDAGMLRFDVFRDMGGLEGALTHQAEAAYTALSQATQASLPGLFSRMIVLQTDSDRVSARLIKLAELDLRARELAEALVHARLFVADLSDSESVLRVAHEALFRQWGRAREWTQENRRLLQAKARLQRAADRWLEEGRVFDHLLNSGRPLDDAQEAAKRLPTDLRSEDWAFLEASTAMDRRRRWLRRSAVLGLGLLTVVAFVSATLAVRARDDAERRREAAMQLSDFMLVDLADKLRPLGNLDLLGSISSRALAEIERQPESAMQVDDLINRSRALRTVGEVMHEQANLAEAEAAFTRAKAASLLAFSKAPDSQAAIEEYGIASFWLGNFHFRQFQLDQALEHWRAYLHTSELLVAKDPKNPNWQLELSYALNSLGGVIRDQGRVAEAMTYFKRSADIKSQVLALRPDDGGLRFDLADTLSWLASAQESEGQLTEAAAGFAEQIAMLTALTEQTPEALVWQRGLATAQLNSARVALARGQLAEAGTQIAASISRLNRLIEREPANRVWVRDLAIAEMQASELALQMGRLADRREHSLRAQVWIEQNERAGDPSIALRRLSALNRQVLAVTRPGSIDVEASNEAIADLERIASDAAGSMPETLALARALLGRGQALAGIQELEEAVANWQQVLKVLGPSVSGSRNPELLATWVSAHCLLGRTPDAAPQQAFLASIGFRMPTYLLNCSGGVERHTPEAIERGH